MNPSHADDGGRDGKGRFGPGNAFGRGCSTHLRAAAIKRGLVDALEPRLGAVAKRMVLLAEAGDVQAARLCFDRALGAVRPEVAEAEPWPFALPDLTDLAACATAAARVVAAAAAGDVSDERAQQLLALIAGARAAVEARAIEELNHRITALEEGTR